MTIPHPLRPAAVFTAQILLFAPSVVAQQRPTGDSIAVAAVRASFQRALAIGDTAAVMQLLSPDVRILEAGGSQTREEYHAEHLASDIAYAMAVPSITTAIRVVVTGDVAWITATSTTTGEFNGRPVNFLGAELMVLRRVAGGAGHSWVIEAVHWSSRRKPT
jgi:ketosteroid isomerase-like protein